MNMFRLLLIAVNFCVSVQILTRDNCPPSLVRDTFLSVHGEKCYRFEFLVKRTFEDAQKYCRKDGGHLVMVKSQDENDFIRNEIINSYGVRTQFFWIGVRYEYSSDTYYWADGSELDWFNLIKVHDHISDECVTIYPLIRAWVSVHCNENTIADSKAYFVCEYSQQKATTSITTPLLTSTIFTTSPLPSPPPSPIIKSLPKQNYTTTTPHQPPPPTTTTTTITKHTINQCPSRLPRDESLKIHRNKCYRFETRHKLNFEDAQLRCQKDGGTLVTVKSKDTNLFLMNEFSHTYKLLTGFAWIGLQYKHLPETFNWMDGSKLGRFHLIEGRHGEPGDCFALKTSGWGTWHNFDCNTKRYFVCEYEALKDASTTIGTTSLFMKSTGSMVTTTVTPSTTTTPATTTTPRTINTPTTTTIPTTIPMPRSTTTLTTIITKPTLTTTSTTTTEMSRKRSTDVQRATTSNSAMTSISGCSFVVKCDNNCDGTLTIRWDKAIGCMTCRCEGLVKHPLLALLTRREGLVTPSYTSIIN